MPFRLKKKETVSQGVRRVAAEQIDRALAELDHAELGVHEKIHQVRKRCKKLRGLLRLVRGCSPELYKRENPAFRDAARRLSTARDAESAIESFDALMEHYDRQIDRRAYAAVRDALEKKRKELAEGELDLEERLASFAEEMHAARGRVADWEIEGHEFAAIAGGLKRYYRRGRKALKAARDDTAVERMHEWRKRVKDHWYHARLLRDIYRPLVSARGGECKRLSDLLGDEHDLAVLGGKLSAAAENGGDDRDREALWGLIEGRRRALRRDAFDLGERIFADKPAALAGRWARYWKSWRNARLARGRSRKDGRSGVVPSPAATG